MNVSMQITVVFPYSLLIAKLIDVNCELDSVSKALVLIIDKQHYFIYLDMTEKQLQAFPCLICPT